MKLKILGGSQTCPNCADGEGTACTVHKLDSWYRSRIFLNSGLVGNSTGVNIPDVHNLAAELEASKVCLVESINVLLYSTKGNRKH